MKFSPGPWRVFPEEDEHYVRVRGELVAQKFHIADVRFGAYRDAYRSIEASQYTEEQREETRANAKLIAAAPELFAALRECVSVLDQRPDAMYGRIDAIVAGQAAIRKAVDP